jgi:hypothetical protein
MAPSAGSIGLHFPAKGAGGHRTPRLASGVGPRSRSVRRDPIEGRDGPTVPVGLFCLGSVLAAGFGFVFLGAGAGLTTGERPFDRLRMRA